MKTKVRERKVIVGIAFAAIMVASIFAMVAPTSMAGTNGGFSPDEEPASSIRIYGDVQPHGNAPEQYTEYLEPFDPTVIPKDSITYNPAIIEENRDPGTPYYSILIGNAAGSPENAREKIFLRSWYEPCGQYNGPRKSEKSQPTINMEFTYMLMNTLYKPAHGTAPNTQFLVPTCEIDTQAGLGAWKSGTFVNNLTTLANVSGIVDQIERTTVQGNISLEKKIIPEVGSNVRFFDHYMELTSVKEDANGEYVIKVGYTGNKDDDAEKGWISILEGQKIYFDRHNNEYSEANHDGAADQIRTWYVRRAGPLLYVGKELNWSDVFYVDAVRYEVTAVEVLDTTDADGPDADAFKYLTLRTKLPKCVGFVRDESVVSSQYIDCIEPAELIPMLPPFNMKHDMVDDIDIPLWTDATEERDWTRQDFGGGTELRDSEGDWIAYDVEMRVIDDIDPLEVTYISELVEERFSTDLLERLQEEWSGKNLETVDLYFLIDGSQSISSEDFQLQLDGLARAIENPAIVPQDLVNPVSVSVIQFSSYANVEVSLTAITDQTVADNVASDIRNNINQIADETNMSAAFYAAIAEMNLMSQGDVQVIDLSTDGMPTGTDSKELVVIARDESLSAGFDVINTLGVGNSTEYIDEQFLKDLANPQPWYESPGFYVHAVDFQDFVNKIQEKIRIEVDGELVEFWTKFDIQSLPDQYTEFVLPALKDYYTIPRDGGWPVELDGDYLITTSWIAPQATGDLYDNKTGGDSDEQRVAFSYDPENGNDIYVHYEEELKPKPGTVKIYGNDSDSTVHIQDMNACNIEEYPEWPDPFNPTAIRKDSITFDTTILQYSTDYPMHAEGENVDLKEYLRVWYVPEYKFYGWHVKEGLAPAIVTETTYMLIDSQDKKPHHANVDSWFPFPIVSDITTDQIGLDSFENPNAESKRKNLVNLSYIYGEDLDQLFKTTNGTIRIEKTYILEEGDEEVQFIDHGLEFNGYDIAGEHPLVTVSYWGNPEGPEGHEQDYLEDDGNPQFYNRHNTKAQGVKHPDSTWYARYDGRFSGDKAMITVGKELQRGDIFYVDGVRYEIPAIEVLDINRDGVCDRFKYITLRTPLPKDDDIDNTDDTIRYLEQHYVDGITVCADSQRIEKIKPCHPLTVIPVLPPMNINHELVDDTDVVLWQPLKLLDKWPYGDIDTGKAGTEYFPCGERYLTMQYPPAAWLKFFRAVPIDTDGDMTTSIPSDWQLWDDYEGPFYPGNVTEEVPDGWQCCKCGIEMPLPDRFTIFDTEHWIANDVNERIISVGPLEFCWKDEKTEPRYSTNLLEILSMDGLNETWTKFDIQTIPDEYTRFNLPEVESLNPEVYVGGEYQLTFEPDIRFDPSSLSRPGCYLITTSFFAPNAKGDLNRGQSYQARNRFAFTHNPVDGTGIYMNKDPVIPTKPVGDSSTILLDVGPNYVSLSVLPDNNSRDPNAIFGRDVEVWDYNPVAGWDRADEIEAGTGYYIYNPWSPKTITVYGTGVSLTWQEIYNNLPPGWNLIGPGNATLPMNGEDNGIPLSAVILKYRQGFPYPYDFMSLIPGPPGEKLEPDQAYWTYKVAS